MLSRRVLAFYILVFQFFCLFLQNQSERFVFIAEWYDPNASLLRRYELLFYPGDGSVEMVKEPSFKVGKGSQVGRGRGLPFIQLLLKIHTYMCIYTHSLFISGNSFWHCNSDKRK